MGLEAPARYCRLGQNIKDLGGIPNPDDVCWYVCTSYFVDLGRKTVLFVLVRMALMFPDSLAVLSTIGLLPSYNALDKMQ